MRKARISSPGCDVDSAGELMPVDGVDWWTTTCRSTASAGAAAADWPTADTTRANPVRNSTRASDIARHPGRTARYPGVVRVISASISSVKAGRFVITHCRAARHIHACARTVADPEVLSVDELRVPKSRPVPPLEQPTRTRIEVTPSYLNGR